MLEALVQVPPGVPAWAAVLATVGSGAIVAVIGWLANRRLNRATAASLVESAQKSAVEIVETALRVARDRITQLEKNVEENTRRIATLHDELARSVGERATIQAKLDVVLVSRAMLEQQIIELIAHVGEKFLPSPPDALVMVDMISGIISYASEGVYTLLGYVPHELVGQPLNVLIPDEMRAVHARHRVEFAKHPRVRPMGNHLKLLARRADGVSIPVEISLHPTGDGRVIALLKRREPEA